MPPPKTVTIVGAGQAGLSLAFGLLQYGYQVTVVSDRDQDAMRHGRILSSQCIFDDAQGYERSLNLNMWDLSCPQLSEFRIGAYLPDVPEQAALSWHADLHRPARSVDQRLKMAQWLSEFEVRGGELRIAVADIDLLETAARESDLVVVAAGKGSLSRLFGRNDVRSTFSTPQRSLAMAYVRMPDGDPGNGSGVIGGAIDFSTIASVGEYITYPALTESGPCTIMLFEAIVGGDMDIWTGVRTGAELLTRARAVLERYLPYRAHLVRDAYLIDDNAWLVGAITPTVRHPVATLPSGAQVMGMGDVVVVNDPITAQGANMATKCAEMYLHAITHHAGAYDANFMNATFERFWAAVGHPTTAFTDHFLNADSEHARDLHVAAARYPEIAQRLAACMNDPGLAAQLVFNPIDTYRAIDRAARNASAATKVPA